MPPTLPHQVLQGVAHQLLLQSFHQGHLDRLRLILCLAVGAEPLRQNWSVLRRRRRASQIIYRERSRLTEGPRTQQVTTSRVSTLLLSLVQRTGPCRGRGRGRSCTGGRWPPAGCRSCRGRGTEPARKTLRRPPDAGGLSSACSPGSSRWGPATEPERTHKEDSQMLLNIGIFHLCCSRVSFTTSLCTWQTYLTNSSAGLLSGRWEPGRTGNSSEGWFTFLVPATFFWIFWVMVKMFWVSSVDTYSWEKVIIPVGKREHLMKVLLAMTHNLHPVHLQRILNTNIAKSRKNSGSFGCIQKKQQQRNNIFLLLQSRQLAADVSGVNWRLVKLCDVVMFPRTRKSTQVPQWLLGSLAASTPLDWGRSRSVTPQFLFHAVVDGCNVGCSGEWKQRP